MDQDEKNSTAGWKINRRGAMGIVGGALAGSLFTAIAEKAHPQSRVSVPHQRRFEEKVVLITGATSGIGRAAAIAFAAEGGKVAFCGRREHLGKEVEREIRAVGGEATYIRADVLVEDDVKDFIDRAVNTYGRL